MKNRIKFKKNLFLNVIVLLFSCILVLPSIILTRYVYPVQDDFHYAYTAMQHFTNGEGLLAMAMKETWNYYLTFMGGYSSTFFGHLFSGIVLCDNIKIKLFCFFSLCFFYIVIVNFIKILSQIFYIPKSDRKYISLFFLILLTGVVYYAEHEDFYWFITSVQYLFLTSCMLLGIICFVKGILSHRNGFLIFAAIGGIIGCGAALNIAFLTIALFSIVAYFLYLNTRKFKKIIVILIFPILGLLVNGLAPGNYIRAGGGKDLFSILEAIGLSYEYTFLRIWGMSKGILFPIVLLIMILWLFSIKIEPRIKYKYPIIVSFILFSIIPFVIFPVMLGYGWNVYLIICRGNFISDLTIYIVMFLIIFYIRNWCAIRFPYFVLNKKMMRISTSIIVVLLFVFLNMQYCKGTAFWREITELRNSKIEQYYKYVRGVYREIENSEEKTVILYREPLEDKTTLINPSFAYGDYPEGEFTGNSSMASFYGKELIVLYESLNN